jgi:hypothetical protein
LFSPLFLKDAPCRKDETKWIPTNQFLNAGHEYKDDTMTLERFGFIGTDKKCFWGMVGVKWITPLKVEQIITAQMTADRKKNTA